MSPVRLAPATSGLSQFDELAAGLADPARRVREVVLPGPGGLSVLLEPGVGQPSALAREPGRLRSSQRALAN